MAADHTRLQDDVKARFRVAQGANEMPNEDLARELDMMTSPQKWPQWPQLPVKRHRDGQSDFGVMVEDVGGVVPDVYRKNLFQKFTQDTPKTSYESMDALLADGWRVD